jgi:cell division protein FtsA
MAKTITISALDIGTSSVKLLVGKKELGEKKVNILASVQLPNYIGVRRGEVYDPKSLSKTISSVVEKAQRISGVKIKKVIVNIGGPHLFILPSQGTVSVSRADQKISQGDIQRALQAAQAVSLPFNKEILEIYPQEFIIDNESGIKNPLGLQGVRLEVKVLLMCVFTPVLENLEQAVSEAGLEIKKIVPSPIAASRAVLTEEQRELGTAVVDMGAGTTSLVVFSEGALRDLAVFPLGSANITNDIAIGLRTEIATAENIKREYGSFEASRKRKAKKGKIEVAEKNLSFSEEYLRNIIRSRISEIFSQTSKALKRTTKETVLPGGVVLTGGGSLLKGILKFAKDKFELPCYLSSLSQTNPPLEQPEFAACCGLLLSGFDSYETEEEAFIGEGFKEKLKKVFKMFLP